MDLILEKINSLESSLNELKTFVLEKMEEKEYTRQIRIHFHPLHSSKEIYPHSNIIYIFTKFEVDDEEIKRTFNVKCIWKEFTQNKRNLYAKKFTKNSDVLLVTDTYEDLIIKETAIMDKINKLTICEARDILGFNENDDSEDYIKCDLNCITVGWALQQLVNDDKQSWDKRCDARIIRSWILTKSFNLDNIATANVYVSSIALHALQEYKPLVDKESIDFVARYENVLSYLSNILAST